MRIGTILTRFIRSEIPPTEQELAELERVLNEMESKAILAQNWPSLSGTADYNDITREIDSSIAAAAVPDATTTVKGKASFNANDFNVSSGAVTIDYTNGQKASATQPGLVTEMAIASELNTGTDGDRAVTPDALAGSNLGTRYLVFFLNGTTALTTSNECYKRIPAAFTGMNLVSVKGHVGTGAAGSSSSGAVTCTVTNVTDTTNMLSTNLTIDQGEYSSATAATAAVINTLYDDVVTDDLIKVACSGAGTGVTYTVVELGFQLP